MSRHTVMFENDSMICVYGCSTDKEAANQAITRIKNQWEKEHIKCPKCGHRWHKNNEPLVTEIKIIKKDY